VASCENRADDEPQIRTERCSAFLPGHKVHWIQIRKALRDDVGIPVTVHLDVDGKVRLLDAGEERHCWHHDTADIAEALALPCGDITWYERFRLLTIETIVNQRFFTLGLVGEALECRS
jgi:hypothetical protein